MTKQEFLAISLPHGFRYMYLNGTFGLFDSNCYEKALKFNANYRIILHPLSDLTKEIEHNGEKFVPEENLLDSEMILRNVDYRMLRFGDIERLISWHFDIVGLIDKGEAIDVNTLSKNPYK